MLCKIAMGYMLVLKLQPANWYPASDGLAPRGIAGHRLARDPHRPRGHVDIDPGHSGQPADLPAGPGAAAA